MDCLGRLPNVICSIQSYVWIMGWALGWFFSWPERHRPTRHISAWAALQRQLWKHPFSAVNRCSYGDCGGGSSTQRPPRPWQVALEAKVTKNMLQTARRLANSDRSWTSILWLWRATSLSCSVLIQGAKSSCTSYSWR